MANLRHDYVRTRLEVLDKLSTAELTGVYGELERGAIAQMEREGISGERLALTRTADLRYLGQGYELEISVPPRGEAITIEGLARSFHEQHRRRYGFANPDAPVELVNLRLTATGLIPRPRLPQEPMDAVVDPESARKGRRQVYLDGSTYDTPIYERDALHAGNIVNGPAVIEQLDSTTLLWPGQRARVGPYRNLIVQ
jgi:N-methylhydantoinase A